MFFLASVLIFCISLFFAHSRSISPRPFLSAILNPSKEKKINKITILTDENERLELKKINSNWFATLFNDEGATTARAENSLLESFVKKVAKIRPLYKISENPSDFSAFALKENAAVVEFFSDEERAIKVLFGLRDALSSRIFFRNDDKTVFETEDDFSQFLTTSLDFWACGEFFSAITETDVQSVRFVAPEKQLDFKADASNDDFSSLAHSLLILRHGNVKNARFFGESRLVATLFVFSGNGNAVKLEIFENAEKVHFSKKTEWGREGEEIVAENAFYEMSDWTFEKIFSLFS